MPLGLVLEVATVLFGKKFGVRPIAEIEQALLPWHKPGLLVLVEGGRGILRWASNQNKDRQTRRTLFLGDVPLLVGQCDEYWCPTCEKLLALGLGRENIEPETLRVLRQVSNHAGAEPASVLDAVRPVLQMLDDGLYVISFVPHFPTNGESQPFWALSRHLRKLRASTEYLLLEGWRGAAGYPSFLLPTQGFGLLDWNRVGEFRDAIRAEKPVGGLALWDGSFLSALLDGHHRATASLLEGRPLTCLTIMSCTGYEIREGRRSLRIWKERIPFSSLPKGAVRHLERPAQQRPGGRVVMIGDGEETDCSSAPHWTELQQAAQRFPDVSGVGAQEVVGEVSDERLANLLAEPKEDEVALVLLALTASHDPRALDLALRVAAAPMPDLWQDAFKYLATQRTQRVEDFFIQFSVRDEGQHPWLEKIVNEYLAAT